LNRKQIPRQRNSKEAGSSRLAGPKNIPSDGRDAFPVPWEPHPADS